MICTTTYQQSSLRSANGGYRYFFNGQESDGEVYGEGGLTGYEFRQYDTRLINSDSQVKDTENVWLGGDKYGDSKTMASRRAIGCSAKRLCKYSKKHSNEK